MAAAQSGRKAARGGLLVREIDAQVPAGGAFAINPRFASRDVASGALARDNLGTHPRAQPDPGPPEGTSIMSLLTVVCPHCNANLRSDRPIPSRRTVRCPDCGEQFQTPAA